MSRVAKLARINKYSNHNSKKVQEVRVISIKIYGLALFAAVLFFGSCLYFIEGQKNVLFEDIPSSVFWVTTVLLGGGIGDVEFSFIAKLLIVLLQFSSLLLFGLLIAIVGQFVERKLLGSSSIE
jgi:hypothetical protein